MLPKLLASSRAAVQNLHTSRSSAPRIGGRGSNPPMGGLDEGGRLRASLADLQSSLNAHLSGLGSHERLEVDGEWGEHTALAFGRVCRVLGLEPVRNVRTFRLVTGATQQRAPDALARTSQERL